MAESDTVKIVQLKSSDEAIFEVEEAAAFLSVTIKNMLEDCSADAPIPLPNVSSKILAKVVEYCKVHVKSDGGEKSAVNSDGEKDAVKTEGEKAAVKTEGEKAAVKTEGEKAVEEEKKAFDKEFVNVDQETLFDIILAANYLNIKSLLDLTCQTVADKIKDYPPDQVRTFFNITRDFTPEEEQKIREDNAWAFEGV